jgi:hypothetical protein
MILIHLQRFDTGIKTLLQTMLKFVEFVPDNPEPTNLCSTASLAHSCMDFMLARIHDQTRVCLHVSDSAYKLTNDSV